MLNRVINEIYHLRRVHAVLPDAVLGDTLKNKLLRLSLQPSLQHLKHAQAELYNSSPIAERSAVVARGLGPGSAVLHTPYALDPGALCNLLDSLAYFHLGTSAVANEAVQLVQLSTPTMSIPQLCTTLAACCALGAQKDITATAMPLLSTALSYYTTDSATNSSSSTSSPSLHKTRAAAVDEQQLIFSNGANVLLLIDALQKADVRETEVWHLLAEHCLRCLEAFDGRQLCSVVTALCAEAVHDYPDFFVAVERHIASQPPSYLSPDQLQQVIQCYKQLHQPVVSLLAIANATPLHGADLERCISAAAAALSNSGADQRLTGVPKHGSSSPSSSTAATTASTPTAPMHHSLEAFESAAVSSFETADEQAVLELLQKCECRRVMTARVVDCVLKRLLTLYYPSLSAGAPASDAAATTQGGAAPSPPSLEQHGPLELQQLSQCLVILFAFNDAALFAHQMKPAPATDAPIPTVTALMNALARERTHFYHPRLLLLVPNAVQLLPASAQPHLFYEAIIDHLRRSSDVSSHERPAQLRSLLDALLALRAYGGEAVLVEYMPAFTVAVLNTPRNTQLELTALLAHMPAALAELIPGVYRQWGSQKRWLRTITEEEVDHALQIMARSGQRNSQLLHAVVEFVQAQRGQLPPQRVVLYLHQMARLGVRDLELFTQTAEQLMRRAVEASPVGGGSGTARCNRSAAHSSAATAAGAAASSSASASAPGSLSPSPTTVRHQQWQMTTVHDLCLLLFTFTFVLRDSIRVTQQVIARLKMCSSAATPRDISLVLYSFAKLRVTRNEEVTGQFCERAAATLGDFHASELASTWNSLRCLNCPHAKLQKRTLELLERGFATEEEEPASASAHPVAAAHSTTRSLTDADCLSLGSALLLTGAAPLNTAHPLVQTRALAERSSTPDADAPPVTPTAPPVPQTVLPAAFERRHIDACRRLLPTAKGQRLYLILCSLSRCPTLPALTLNAWETMLTLVDTHAESLMGGRLGETPGMAQLEVMAALRFLHARVADVDALAAAEAVRADESAWATPYCPPGLWVALRPRWRELSRSNAVQASPALMDLVGEMKRSGREALAEEVPRKGSKKLMRARKAPVRKAR